jgi:predicted dehydrogenase
MSEKVKVGVVGVGALGRHHTRLYQQCEEAELVGIFDVNPEQACKIAEELSTQVFENLDELSNQVDAFSIAVPTNYHFEIAKDLLHKGKHLLIEKPITVTLEEADTLNELAKERELIIQVGHVERFNPVISYLEEKINDPRFIECHRLANYPPPRPNLPPRGTEVGVVLDLMIHDIDMVLSLVRSRVTEVDAIGIPVLSPTEDIANARLKFENGCVANLTASRVSPERMRKIRVFQSNCYLSLDYQETKGEIYFKDGMAIRREQVPIEPHNALLKQLEHFLQCILEKRQHGKLPEVKVSGEHGRAALELAVAIRDKMGIQ